MDTNVPLRGKLYRTTRITAFKKTFKLVKEVSKGLRHDLNIAHPVWAYDAHTLDLIKGSPFPSKTKAETGTGVNRTILTQTIDTGKPEGKKSIYFYNRQLTDKEIKVLLTKADKVRT